jgi:hypothetical protein
MLDTTVAFKGRWLRLDSRMWGLAMDQASMSGLRGRRVARAHCGGMGAWCGLIRCGTTTPSAVEKQLVTSTPGPVSALSSGLLCTNRDACFGQALRQRCRVDAGPWLGLSCLRPALHRIAMQSRVPLAAACAGNVAMARHCCVYVSVIHAAEKAISHHARRVCQLDAGIQHDAALASLVSK